MSNHDPQLPAEIVWSDFYDGRWAAQATSVLVRHVAKAEILMERDPVRARSQDERQFREGLVALYAALDLRADTELRTVLSRMIDNLMEHRDLLERREANVELHAVLSLLISNYITLYATLERQAA